MSLVAALEALGVALGRIALPLELPGVEDARGRRDELIGQLDDYVLPRLRQLDAPLLAVVGGSTGAGKSTLVNALVGRRVTAPGVLRPTTRSPVLVCNPADEHWFADDRILPELARATAATADPGALQLVPDEGVPVGLALLDAPDIDSVETRNRELAAQLLAAADLWLFVTSAARYADQVPWGFLRAAADRSAAVAVVLDRIPAGAEAEVTAHLRSMLDGRGLASSPLFAVGEAAESGGILPADLVSEVHGWLHGLASDATARTAVVRQTLDGAIASLGERGDRVADAHATQVMLRERLRAETHASYSASLAAVDDACADGSLLRGEVLARWQEFVGTGELTRSLEARVGRVRDRVGAFFRGRPPQVAEVTVAVESGLEALVLEQAEAAAERAALSWSLTAAGKALLSTADGDLSRASRDFRAAAERAVRDWQHAVLELVRAEGAGKRSTARFMAFGVNGLAASLMVVVFAHTGGLTGAEVGIAGGSAVLAQKVLEAVFGDEAVRRLAEGARTDLQVRVAALYDAEAGRFDALLEALGLDATATAALQDALAAVGRASASEGAR